MRAKLALLLHLGGVGECRRLIWVWSVQAQSWMRTCTHIRNQGIYTPTCLRFWGSRSLVESKRCDYVMFEADSHLKLLPTSI